MVKKKHIAQKSHISSIPLKQIPGSKILNIEIEKILSGQALVIIDGKWRARLLNENYEGPKNLIKRGSRFMALCEVYHDSGVPFVKVRQVTTTRT